MPAGFIPEQDKGYLVVNAQLPDGASLERTDEVDAARDRDRPRRRRACAHTIDLPGYSVLTSTNISNVGGMFVILEPFEERAGKAELGADAVLGRAARSASATIQEAQVVVFGAPPVDGLGSTGGFKLQVQDRARRRPRGAAGRGRQRRRARATRSPGLVGLFSSFSVNQPQLYVDVDRDKAKAHGVALERRLRDAAGLPRLVLRQRLHLSTATGR